MMRQIEQLVTIKVLSLSEKLLSITWKIKCQPLHVLFSQQNTSEIKLEIKLNANPSK